MALEGLDMKVSIIIPVYAVSPYIERCVRSVMNQTYASIECVFVNDASPDDSIEKCEKMIASYQGPINFSILHHERNRGLSAARNTGLKAATGEYVFFMDSDDELPTDCIAILMKPVLDNPAIEMVQGNYELFSNAYPHGINPKRRELHDVYLSSLSSTRSCFYDKKAVNVFTWNKLVRRDFLYQHQLFFKEGLLWEDSLWMFYVMKYLSRLYITNQVTYYYYKRPGSITTSTNRKTRCSHLIRKFDEISHNFTVGESGREAKYFLYWVCFCLNSNCTDKSFDQTLLSFKRALVADGYTKEELYLSTVMFLSKSALGRGLCRKAFRMRDRMKKNNRKMLHLTAETNVLH